MMHLHFPPSIKCLLLLAVAVVCSYSLCPESPSSSTRRAFIAKKLPFVIIGGSTAATLFAKEIQVANAYGEFEPGAKARKKAAKENKLAAAAANNSGGGGSQQQSIRLNSEEDLKASLGGFSYSTSSNKKTK